MSDSADDEPVGAEPAAQDEPPRKPRRRLWRRLFRVFVVAFGLLIGAIAVSLVSTQTPWFKDWLRRYIARQATSVLDGELSIGRLEGTLFGGVTLDRVALAQHGQPVISIARVRVHYSVLELISNGIILDELVLQQPVIVARQTSTGWNVAHLVKQRPSKPGSAGPSIAISRLSISDGQVLVYRQAAPDATNASTAAAASPTRLDDLDARLGLTLRRGTLTLDLGHVSFDLPAEPRLRFGHVGGRLVRRADTLTLERLRIDLPTTNMLVDGSITRIGTSGGAVTDLAVASSSLAFREVGRFVPALRSIPLQPSFTARLRGPFDRLDTELHVQSAAGKADGRVLVDFAAGNRRFAGEMALVRVNPAPWAIAPAFEGSVTGRATFDLRLADSARRQPFTGTFHFVGPDARVAGYAGQDVDAQGQILGPRLTIERGRAQAYGAAVTVAGIIEPVPGEAPGAQYRLQGHARNLDLRRLPASLPVPDLESRLEADYKVSGRGTEFSGEARLAASTVEGAALEPGTVGHFALEGGRMSYGGSGRVTGLNLPRFGEALELDALTDRRFDGTINGTFTLEASGRTVRDLQLAADAHLEKTSLLGADLPDVTLKTSIEGGRLAADVKGSFASLEPDFVTGIDELSGTLNGQVDGRVTLSNLADPITFETVGFDGRIELLPSTLRGIEIGRAHLVGGFAGRRGRFDEATIVSPIGEITASGPLALDETGSSNLTYRVRGGNLARLSALFDQTMTGTADVEGTVTGQASVLTTTGKAHVEQAAVANALKGDALDLQFTAAIPDLAFARATVDADVNGKGLTVADQRVDTLTGKVGYRERALTFDARAADRTRTVDAAGRVDLADDRQHLVLSKLTASVDGQTWQLRPGTEATIDRTARQIEVSGLSVTHDAAHVDADGTLAVAADGESRLEVRIEGLPLADVSRLLRQTTPQYTGLLTGAVTIGGTRQHPEVVGQFAVAKGTWREVHFEQFTGIVHYDGRFLGTDVTLVQQAGTTVTAKGLVPLSLIQGDEAAKGRDPIDLRIESSTIGLEVASGITAALSNLSGTGRINLHVTGTADNPAFEGGVNVTGGGFTVVPTGRHYSDVTSSIRFEPGKMVIDHLHALDENKDPLEVTGELGLRRTAFGRVSLKAKASEFGVLGNEFGTADVDADLTITGELTAPKVEGEISVHTGRIEVDEVLARLIGSAYATEPQDDVPIPGEGITPTEPTVGTITTSTGQTRSVRLQSDAGKPAATARDADAKDKKAPREGASLNVRVKIPDNLVLRGRDIRTSSRSLGLGNMNVTVGGDFRVRKDPGTATALVGLVNTVRGTYDFRGRRFDILRDGRIQFQGDTPIDPALDVTAERVIQPSGVEARIRIQGTARNPTLSFSSTPPLDEADILALIVFNRPLNSLGSNEKGSLVDLAGATAAGFVVSPLTESLGRALNIDLFEVQATSEGGNTGGLVTIGEQVGERLFFKFRQQFGAQEVSEFVLEYQLRSFLRLQAAAADGDGVGRANRSLTRRIERAGLDLIFYFSY